MNQKAHSWDDLARLTHEIQVAEFGFCTCEDMDDGQEAPYNDCPEPTINDIKRNIEETLGEDWCPDCNQPPHLCTCKPDTGTCIDCGAVIDWNAEGGIIWAGDTFCENCDPLEPVYCGDHLITIDECGCKP